MIIESISKDKKGKYLIKIGSSIYEFNEDIIVEFNLYKGKEIDDKLLYDAISSNSLNDYYNKALVYSTKYFKGSGEVIEYLKDKGLNENDSKAIVNKLTERRIINDEKIVESLIYSLSKSSNGRLLIKEKLLAKRFDSKLIDLKLNCMDLDIYFEGLNKLYEKNKHKYDKYPDYVRIAKLKNYLYSRGYTSNDISNLDIK